MADRDANGRFVKGHAPTNNGKGGRKRRSVEEKYLEAIKKAVSVDDLQAIFNTGFARAKAGDLGWAKLICEYLIGKPTQYVDQSIDLQGAVGLTVEYVNDWREN